MNTIIPAMTVLAAALASESGSAENKAAQIDCGHSAAAQAGANDVAARQLLVRFDDDLSEERIDQINRRLGTVVINRMAAGRLLLVEVPYAGTLAEIRAAYSATPGVRYAEPNPVVRTQPAPDVPKPDSGSSGQPGIIIDGSSN